MTHQLHDILQHFRHISLHPIDGFQIEDIALSGVSIVHAESSAGKRA